MRVMSTLRQRVAVGAVAACAALVLASAGLRGQGRGAPAPMVPGTGTFYIGTYAGSIAILDEATEKVIGQIPSKIGIPGDLTLSMDRSRLYVNDASFEKVEIIDRVKRESLDTFTLSHDRTKTRIWDLQPDPHDRYLILQVKDYTLLNDRWDVGQMKLVQYDLATHKISRTIPWPDNQERDGVGVIFSPDGKLMYMFGDEVLIYETENFTQVDKWDVSRPIEEGAGPVSVGGLDPFSDEPGFYTGLLTMNDRLQNRRIMGIGRVDLANKKIAFHPIGPARGVSFSIAPDHKKAYGLLRDIGEYEFWTFDVETARVASRTPFRGRPRMGLRVSSNGNVLYIYQAGNTIDLYDAATLKPLRTITLDGDMTRLILLPPPRPGAARH